MQNNVQQGQEVTDAIIRGIKLATDALRPTYGNFGVNAIIECDEQPFHKIVNDAWTIVEAIKTTDKWEKFGLNLVKEGLFKQDGLSGDGRKTTAIILDELVTLGSQLDMPRVQLKKELDALISLVESKIDEQKHLITEDEVSAVASIAGESEEIGKLLGEIYKKIGKDGIIHLEPSGTPETKYTVTEGVRFNDASYLAQSMANTPEKRAEYENPVILVTKKKISNLNEINPLLETLIKRGDKSLVIFTDDMETSVASALVRVHLDENTPLSILIIKAPVIWKNYIFEDFAKCVGATIVEDATGLNLKTLPLSALGTCGKIITDSKETILLNTQDISSHIAELKQEGSHDSKLRLSWLVTKTCNLYLGGNSESDLYYKTMKCKDAINSSRLALADGVVSGGGTCLTDISLSLLGDNVYSIIVRALQAPMVQLAKNSNIAIEDYKIDENVLDSSIVLKNAVRSAVSLASTALTIGVSIPFIDKTEEELRLLGVTKQAF